MIVNNSSADQFLKRWPAGAIFFLVHGNDEGLIRERARKLVALALGDDADPLRLVRMDGDAVARELILPNHRRNRSPTERLLNKIVTIQPFPLDRKEKFVRLH